MISFGLIGATTFLVMALLVVWHFLPCISELKAALKRNSVITNDYAPSARVILCLRGSDPFLHRCLRGLMNQNYPDYKVLIVIDSPQDDVLPQVEHLLRDTDKSRFDILFRNQLFPHCSRRASSLFCGLNHVPDDTEVIVMCDADAIPHPTWLRELVAPMQDSLTVAASGNRWYAPMVLTMGGLCRYFWNALAFRAMYRYRIPWCGSLAMRRDLFRDPDFQHCLKHAFSEDTALAGFLANKKQHAHPIVSLVVLNEETVKLKSFWGFLVRQMLAARLNHPHWPTILTEATVIFAVMWVLLPLSIIQGKDSLTWWLVGAATFDTIVLSVIGYFESLVRQCLWKHRSQKAAPFNLLRILMMPVGLAVTGFIYPIAVAVTVFVRYHEWRGVIYRIESHGITTVREREKFISRPVRRYESVS